MEQKPIGNNIVDCCTPSSEEIKKMMEGKLLPPPPKPPSITDMLGGPSITSQLGPILSGVSKMISTLPTKTKLEGNINGGNFSIEVVDTITCHMAIDFLNQIMKNFETKKKKA